MYLFVRQYVWISKFSLFIDIVKFVKIASQAPKNLIINSNKFKYAKQILNDLKRNSMQKKCVAR